MRKQNQNIAAMGSFADFNVWSRALSDDEMRARSTLGGATTIYDDATSIYDGATSI